MEKKIIYYTDPINDDFALSENSGYTTPEKYKYKMGRFNYFITSLIYHLLIIPIAYAASKFTHGLKIYGRKNLKGLKEGFYIILLNLIYHFSQVGLIFSFQTFQLLFLHLCMDQYQEV